MANNPLPLSQNNLPPAPPLKKLLGPSFIILGLGLGSGEIVLWPYLSSNYGLGLVWAIVIGVTIQFFINMEVERYALVNGESVFVGFARWLKILPFWFILSTFLGFGWPGIGLAGSNLFSHAIPNTTPTLVAIVAFVSIGLVLTLGKVLYQTVETLQKYLILFGTPAIFLLTLYLSSQSHWQALASGLVGFGPGYNFLPAGISLATFLGALAYSGAGGNLNLAQSFYVRDKGYGMGFYADRIKSLLTSSDQSISLTGSTFPLTPENISSFKKWWRLVNLEHFLIFWVLGLFTMLTLSLLSYATTFGHAGNVEGINFVLNEAVIIGQRTAPFVGTLFLLITGLMLTATQLTVLDSTSRIITENLLLIRGASSAKVSRIYYLVLWFQILFGLGVIFLGFTQPRQLITLGAVINAFTMFVYILLLLRLNNKSLAPPLRPHILRNAILLFSALFFGTLFVLTLLS